MLGKKYFQILVIVLIPVLCFTACNSGNPTTSENEPNNTTVVTGEPKTIRLAHNNTTDEKDTYHYFAVRFKELLEKNSNGRYKVEIFAKSYGDEREMFEACQLGTCDIAVSTNAQIGSFCPTAFAIDLPFIFSGNESANAALDSAAAQAILDSFEAIGIKGLAFGSNGFRQVITNNKGITSLADCKGMKIRCMENQLYVSTYNAIGVNAVPLAFAEVISGIQQNLLNGLDVPYSVIYAQSLDKVCGYCSELSCFFNASAMVANLDFFNKLPVEDQEIMVAAAKEAARLERDFIVKEEDNLKQELISRGLTVVAPDDLTQFQDAVSSIYGEYSELIGGTYVKDLVEAAKVDVQ